MEDAIGEHLTLSKGMSNRFVSTKRHDWFYRWAMERGTFDILLDDYLVAHFLKIFEWSDRSERRLSAYLTRKHSTLRKRENNDSNAKDLT